MKETAVVMTAIVVWRDKPTGREKKNILIKKNSSELRIGNCPKTEPTSKNPIKFSEVIERLLHLYV